MTHKAVKIAIITSIAMLASAGTAFAAGDKENCDHKKKTTEASATQTDAAANQTAVLGVSEMATKKTKDRKILSFDGALKLCNAKAADNLQACIDYKTGVTKVYEKPAT